MAFARQVELRKRRLAAVFERALSISAQSEELRADYARHLCVLLSGFLEKSIAEIIVQYANGKAASPLRAYVETSLRRLTNIDKDRLLNLIGSFDARWREQLDAFVVDERQAAINSIVGLRNDIAHGGGGSISLLQVEKYWKSIQEIVDKLAEIMLSDPRQPITNRRRRL